MKTFSPFIVLIVLFLFPPIATQAQTSGPSLTASLEHRDIPYFNKSNYIDAYTLNLGFDKCIAKGWVWYIGFRYTNAKGQHTCTECGVYTLSERQNESRTNVKSYYQLSEIEHAVGIPLGFKYYLPSYPHSRAQFFVEIGGINTIFSRRILEGNYWLNDTKNESVIEGPFLEDNTISTVKWLDFTALVSVGGEIAFDNEWSMIAKPYLQYDGNWAIGGMIGVKRVLDNGYW